MPVTTARATRAGQGKASCSSRQEAPKLSSSYATDVAGRAVRPERATQTVGAAEVAWAEPGAAGQAAWTRRTPGPPDRAGQATQPAGEGRRKQPDRPAGQAAHPGHHSRLGTGPTSRTPEPPRRPARPPPSRRAYAQSAPYPPPGGVVAQKRARLAHDLSQKCHETAPRLCTPNSAHSRHPRQLRPPRRSGRRNAWRTDRPPY